MLISAGYHRARINTLSEFDKVVGGLCWCITSSGEDVDVDILFQENSTIGQRITLSEAISSALRKMSCPCPLQPHQIQGGIGGSDYPALQPVIVWLVKKFFERREEREKQLRRFSNFQFSKNYEFPDSMGDFDLAEFMNKTKAVRLYKRKEAKRESEVTRVHSCLLEYGEKMTAMRGEGGKGGAAGGGAAGGGAGSAADYSFDIKLEGGSGENAALSGFERNLLSAAREAMKEDELLRQNSSREEAELMGQMKEVEGDATGQVSGRSIGAIVGLGSSEIGSAAALYESELDAAKQQLESSLGSGKLGQAATYKRQRQNLLKARDEVESKATEVAAALAVFEERLRIIDEEARGAADYNGKLLQQLGKLGELEAASTQQAELATLKNLVIMNETLKAQEAAFKASCKAQLADYNARIKALEETDAEDSEATKKLQDIEDMYAKVMAKYNRLRQLLAETNLEIASNVRIIDDVPTRTELIQYERRFAELYQQVAWKLVETKKYFALYNQYETTLSFLQKEIKLLNSISENFQPAMRNAQGKEEYLKQFELIIVGVEQSVKAQEAALVKAEANVEDLRITNQNLVDEQRRYFQAVKDFQLECEKNPWLTDKYESIKQGGAEAPQ